MAFKGALWQDGMMPSSSFWGAYHMFQPSLWPVHISQLYPMHLFPRAVQQMTTNLELKISLLSCGSGKDRSLTSLKTLVCRAGFLLEPQGESASLLCQHQRHSEFTSLTLFLHPRSRHHSTFSPLWPLLLSHIHFSDSDPPVPLVRTLVPGFTWVIWDGPVPSGS